MKYFKHASTCDSNYCEYASWYFQIAFTLPNPPAAVVQFKMSLRFFKFSLRRVINTRGKCEARKCIWSLGARLVVLQKLISGCFDFCLITDKEAESNVEMIVAFFIQ